MKRVTIIGVGALGSHVVPLLRNGVQIKVIDFDRIEQKNVLSQFHARNSVGKSKVQALQQTMQFLWGTKIDVIPHKLVADNAEQLLGGADLLIDCLDNGEARRIVQKFARKNSVPCLHGALAADGLLGAVVWDEDFHIDDAATGAATCEDGEFLPFIALTSSYIARVAQEYLSSGKKLGYHVYPRGASTKI